MRFIFCDLHIRICQVNDVSSNSKQLFLTITFSIFVR